MSYQYYIVIQIVTVPIYTLKLKEIEFGDFLLSVFVQHNIVQYRNLNAYFIYHVSTAGLIKR